MDAYCSSQDAFTLSWEYLSQRVTYIQLRPIRIHVWLWFDQSECIFWLWFWPIRMHVWLWFDQSECMFDTIRMHVWLWFLTNQNACLTVVWPIRMHVWLWFLTNQKACLNMVFDQSECKEWKTKMIFSLLLLPMQFGNFTSLEKKIPKNERYW